MGQIDTRVYVRGSSALWADMSLTYSESATNITANTSTISWSVTAAQINDAVSHNFFGTDRANGCTVKVFINGTSVLSKALGLTKTPSSWTQSGTHTVTHNADGNKTIPVTLEIDAGTGNYTNDPWTYGSSTLSQSVALTYLPRLSTISAGAFTMGSAGTITVTRQSTSFTHTLRYSFGSASGTIASKSSSTSISWTPPLSLCSQIPSATAGQGTISCDTYSGDTKLGTKSITVKLSVPSSVKPTVDTFTSAITNPSAASSWGIAVQGKSSLTLSITKATGAYGSTIKSYSITGASYSAAAATLKTGVLSKSGTLTFSATVTDSRGRTSAAKTLSVSVQPYAAPSLSSATVERCIANGTPSEDGTCLLAKAVFSVSSCSGKNACSLVCKYRKSGASSWTNSGAAFTSGTAVVFGSAGISADSSYEVQFTLSDSFTTSTVTQLVSTAAVVLDLRSGGTGIGLGKVSEINKSVEINPDWNLYLHGKELISTIHQAILDKAYPVGAVYLSISSTNPGSFLGGTWVQIAQGRFLLGQSSSYAVKATGGESTHKLSVAEMPSHTHTVSMTQTSAEGSGYGLTVTGGFVNRVLVQASDKSINTKSAGSTGAHNNMPPYYVVYMFERTK